MLRPALVIAFVCGVLATLLVLGALWLFSGSSCSSKPSIDFPKPTMIK